MKNATYHTILESLDGQISYGSQSECMSPFYSDIGLRFGPEGINYLQLHYNRQVTAIGPCFLGVPGDPTEPQSSPLGVEFVRGETSASIAFYAHNSWLVEFRGMALHFDLPVTPEPVELWVDRNEPDPTLLVHCRYATIDGRDADSEFPFVLGIRVLRGTAVSRYISPALIVEPDNDGAVLVAFSAQILDIHPASLLKSLQSAPGTIDDAAESTARWFAKAFGKCELLATDPAERAVLAKAAYTLVANATEAPGMLRGRVASFPSRGKYACHYLWDSCFQNLALEHMEPRLAEDAMLLLVETLRPDGKMGHFLTSTWMRPGSSQPPLVGWAGLRLVKRRGDTALARKLLDPLVRNTAWWYAYRMTRYGLICCSDPLETGWDNTPRLDNGPVLACDMNSYLLMQMRACAEMARMVGDSQVEQSQRDQADRLAARMVEVLYNTTDHLFHEVLVRTGEPLPVKTPACFLPLLAEVPIDPVEVAVSIEQHLLNPAEFFGNVPFPSVAYDDPSYNAGGWWRGPTWLPIAYFMLQILKKYGYERQWREASERLYGVAISDGRMSELFESQTGRGKGSQQQGWTAAIVLRLHEELAGRVGTLEEAPLSARGSLAVERGS